MARHRSVLIGLLLGGLALAPAVLLAQPGSGAAILDSLDHKGHVELRQSGVTVSTWDFDADSERVEAIAFRPTAGTGLPAVLLIPGFGRTARDYLPFGVRLAKEGYACVAVSQRGFGKSTGRPDFVGPATVRELAAAFERLRAESYVDPARVGILGYSRGAIAASLLATQLAGVRAAVFAAGIYDFPSAYRDIQLEGIRENMRTEAGDTTSAFGVRSSLGAMERLHCPVLILHGEKDENAPVSQARMLEARLKELHKDYEIRISPDQDHNLGMQNLLSGALDFFGRRLKALPGK